MKIIFDYNRTIYDPDSGALYPGVAELLARLAAGHELFLVSKNEPGRREKLEELGIAGHFRKAVFTDGKDEALFRDMAGDAEDVLVVGDRVRGEIRVGNALGWKTVWVRQGKFAEEMPSGPEEEPKHVIGEIGELEKIISVGL